MKLRILSLFVALTVIIFTVTGCGGNSLKSGKISIVATTFPEYDWVMNILGEDNNSAEVTLLLDNGVDLHSYQPTADDIIKVSSADMFIYIGGESDEWVDDILKESTNKNMVVISLMDVLGNSLKEEEIKDGMQADEEEEEEGEEPEYDEHIWLSLKNAAKLCEYIGGKLCEIDPENKGKYKTNTEAYIDKINALDKEYTDAVQNASTKTLLFGDRFPFRYLTEDYGLDYYAAFVGCSTESKAGFETIIFLANKVDELGLKSILQIESADGKIATAVKQATKTQDQQILTLNSMQSATLKDVENGVTYLSVMENNLSVLKEALK